ncbi:hypothetical protein F5Y01DRAFT_299082 [Xylaria sp. FL0043]|nr:hypothetical protein F5Y01DRAFT_299082 [Xylaria sp. FL0043]
MHFQHARFDTSEQITYITQLVILWKAIPFVFCTVKANDSFGWVSHLRYTYVRIKDGKCFWRIFALTLENIYFLGCGVTISADTHRAITNYSYWIC